MDRKESLKAWMVEKGVSRGTLAQCMGIDTNYVHKIMAGKRPVTDSFVGRFATVYGFEQAKRAFDGAMAGEPAR